MMTQPLTQEAFAALGGPDLVYVRPVRAEDILSTLPPGSRYEAPLVPDQVLYALHSADGSRLAVLVDRDSAYAAARAHELAPVSVH
jgi:hypothetical protein